MLSPVPFLRGMNWQQGSSWAQVCSKLCGADKQGSHSTGAGAEREVLLRPYAVASMDSALALGKG